MNRSPFSSQIPAAQINPSLTLVVTFVVVEESLRQFALGRAATLSGALSVYRRDDARRQEREIVGLELAGQLVMDVGENRVE